MNRLWKGKESAQQQETVFLRPRSWRRGGHKSDCRTSWRWVQQT